MTQQGYNTNLAAEFHVLSVLHRMGMEAMLTLGNKKSVDIVVVRNGSKVLSLDVKGLAGKSGWPVDNLRLATPDHFLAFVCYAGRIHDPEFAPEVDLPPLNSTISRERIWGWSKPREATNATRKEGTG